MLTDKLDKLIEHNIKQTKADVPVSKSSRHHKDASKNGVHQVW